MWTQFLFFSLLYLCLDYFLYLNIKFMSLSRRVCPLRPSPSPPPLWSFRDHHHLCPQHDCTLPSLCLCCHIVFLDFKLLMGGLLLPTVEAWWATAHLLPSWSCPWSPCELNHNPHWLGSLVGQKALNSILCLWMQVVSFIVSCCCALWPAIRLVPLVDPGFFWRGGIYFVEGLISWTLEVVHLLVIAYNI